MAEQHKVPPKRQWMLLVLVAFFGGSIFVVMVCEGELHPQELVGTELSNGPLRKNSINPRYFTENSGRAIYLTGSHTWDNFQDWGGPTPLFDFSAYLDFLKKNNHNFVRLWVWETTGAKGSDITPQPWQRTGPGLATDGKPKFDLTNFDESYFERLSSRISEAGNRGIYVSIMLFQEYINWPTHPFNSANNINGIDGDRNSDGDGREIHTLAVKDVTVTQEAYVRKIIDTVNHLDNVLYEVGNELKRDTIEWQHHIINYIHEYERGKPKRHPAGMTSSGGGCEKPNKCVTNGELFSSPADWISPNVERGQDYASDPPAADGNMVVISDTDHLDGVLDSPTVEWVWKTFLRGLNPIVMDAVQHGIPGSKGARWNDPNNLVLPPTRVALGHTLTYANRINLARLIPNTGLCSTGYCLVDPGKEYLVYLPSRWSHSIPLIGNSVTVDLSDASATFNVEWFNPNSGETIPAGTITAGTSRTLTAPFDGAAVLYLAARKS